MDRYGTFISYDTDSQGLVEIYYPDDQALGLVAVGEDPVFQTSSSGGGKYKEAVPITTPIAKFASEISQTSSINRDLIVVGGPCANELTKALLNAAWEVDDSCEAYRADDDLNGAGKGLLSIVEDAFDSGQKALVISGWEGDDTRNLIKNKVIKPTEMAKLSGTEWKGSI
ncbi:S-layer protein [bacterium]|nr:S-layer protein [bacterium]